MTGYACRKTKLTTTSARCIGGVPKCDCKPKFARNSPNESCMPEENCWTTTDSAVTQINLDKQLDSVNIAEPTVPNMEPIKFF